MGQLHAHRAAGMLLTGDERIAVIPGRTGFCSGSHLASVFTGRFGVTPGRYRREGGRAW